MELKRAWNGVGPVDGDERKVSLQHAGVEVTRLEGKAGLGLRLG